MSGWPTNARLLAWACHQLREEGASAVVYEETQVLFTVKDRHYRLTIEPSGPVVDLLD